MLIEFSVENFRSIKERVTLSMIAANLKSRDPHLDERNVIQVSDKLALLRSALVYGANASGKSNLLDAFRFMRSFVIRGTRDGSPDARIGTQPFLLSSDYVERPSVFEVVFLIDGVQHRFGFTANTRVILSEWLYCVPSAREAMLYVREGQNIRIGERFGGGAKMMLLTLPNALFLPVAAEFNHAYAGRVQRWFANTSRTLSTVSENEYLPYTLHCLRSGEHREQIEEFVRRIDTDVSGLAVADVPMPDELIRLREALSGTGQVGILRNAISGKASVGSLDQTTMLELRTRHVVRDSDGKAIGEVVRAAAAMESEGTQKIIGLAGPLFDVLSNGYVLLLDEIDARLHPSVSAEIVRLFNSPDTNPHGAQLICVTHDTNLLDRKRFRRDQIYFVEKDRTAATRLYSLADFKLKTESGKHRAVRNDASYEADYIQGRYGAIPYLGDIGRLFIEAGKHKATAAGVGAATESEE
jgi:uncharacterized protein